MAASPVSTSIRARSRSTARTRACRAAFVAVLLVGAAGLAGTTPAGATPPPVQQTVVDNGLHKPIGVAVDGAGNIYVADSYNNRVLELPKGGGQVTLPITVTSPAGLAVSAAGDVYVAETNGGRVIELPHGGTAIDLPFSGLNTAYGIYGVAVDAAGDVFVADTGNNRIVELPKGGSQVTVPLHLPLPFGIAVDGSGAIYASQAYGAAVVKLPPGGVQTALPFSGLQGPWGLAVDAAGNAFVADFRRQQVIELSTGGTQTTLPFTGLFEPKGVAVDASGNVFVADYNSRILELSGGVVTTAPFTGLSGSTGVAVDQAGTVYVADDYMNGRVQRVAGDGTLTDLGFTGLSNPGGIAVDKDGNVYVANWSSSLVFKRTPAGVQTTLGFSGLQQPASVAVDDAGAVYVTDTGHARVVVLPPSGPQATVGFSGLTGVSGLAVDAAGTVYVGADSGRVVARTSGGVQTTLGFTGLSGVGSIAVDGAGNVFAIDYPANRVVELPAGGAQTTVGFTSINQPWGVAVDASGNVYVTAHAPSAGLVVLPAGTPNAPLDITAEPGVGSATVSWRAPSGNGSPVTGYVVTPVVDGVDQTPQVFASTALSQTVSGLHDGTTYTFRVAATNVFGTGPAGTGAGSITVGAPLRPVAFMATDPGDGAATLSWWPPAANAAPITGYTITPVVNGVRQPAQSFAGPATTRTVTGLTNGVHYVFEVTATNAMGTSSVATSATTVGTPSRPWVFLRGQPGTTSVDLSWWAPPANAGPILGYAIAPFIGWQALPATFVSSPVTHHTVTGLTTGVTYSFKVTGWNALGLGGTASTIQLTVGAPASPTAVTAVAGPGQATVSWSAPAANAAPISSYRIVAYVGWVPQQVTTVGGGVTSQVISGLTPGVSYTFHVIATNAVGSGPQSAASPAVVPT